MIAKKLNVVRELIADTLPVFYTQKEDSRGKIKFEIQNSVLSNYLNEQGFRAYNSQFIRITDNVAQIVDEKVMYQECLKYVEKFKDRNLTSDFMSKGASLLLNQKGIVYSLKDLEIDFLRDTEDAAYLCFENGILKITKESKELLKYGSIEGVIWKEKIINRPFMIVTEQSFNNSMFARFIYKITDDDLHHRSLITSIGYCLHRYKNPAIIKALIINDITLAEDGTPQGGTGKGLVINAISQLINVTVLNGKNIDLTRNRFCMQNVDLTTDLVSIDDADKNFNFEELFSTLSSGIDIERKHKDSIKLDFKDSPKMAITTNYAIKGISSSHKRRKHDVFINGHYSHELSPYDDFNCEFFHQWDDKEWRLFDNYMVYCLQDYLTHGLVEYSTHELEEKMLINQTSREFWEVMEEGFGDTDEKHYKGQLRDAIKAKNPAYHNLAFKKINQWLKMYAEHKILEIKYPNRTSDGITYVLKSKVEDQPTPEETFDQEGDSMFPF